MPHPTQKPLEPLPGKAANPELLRALAEQAKYGGARSSMADLAAIAGVTKLLGVPGAALAGISGQEFGNRPKDDKTVALRADIPGDKLSPQAAQLAEIILAVPKNKLPRVLKELFATTREEGLVDAVRQWTKLGEGAFRKAFQKQGVVAKVPKRLDASSISPHIQNFNEFMELVREASRARRDNPVRIPKPYAYSPKSKVVFSQYTKPGTWRESEYTPEMEEVVEYADKMWSDIAAAPQQRYDGFGDEKETNLMEFFNILFPRKGQSALKPGEKPYPFALVPDIGFAQRPAHLPEKIEQALWGSENWFIHPQEQLGPELPEAAKKLLSVYERAAPSINVAGR